MLHKTTYLIILAAFVVPIARAQEANKACSDGRTIKIVSRWDQLGLTMAPSDVAAQPLRYSISRLQGVQGAWIEVWDRPKRLSRRAIPVRLEGEAACANCLEAGETPSELRLSIFDAEEPMLCIDYCAPGTPTSGAYVSEVTVGKSPVEDSDESVEPAYLMDFPELTGDPIRIVEGSGSIDFVLLGENLISSSRAYVVTGEDTSPKGKAARTYLYSRTLDLRHVLVTIPSDLADKPGTLTAYAKDAWEGQQAEPSGAGQKIIVVSKESPVIHSVEPRVLHSRGRDATVTLRGSGFTKDSEVKFGDQLGAGAEVTFVSSNELKVRIPATELEDSSERHARATRCCCRC